MIPFLLMAAQSAPQSPVPVPQSGKASPAVVRPASPVSPAQAPAGGVAPKPMPSSSFARYKVVQRAHTMRHRHSPALSTVASANAAATREPAPSGYLNAVQVYPYTDGMLYRLYAAPERVSDIALEPGETLVAVASGDTVRWTIGDATSGTGETRRTHILVKPFSAGLTTNLVITTDRRTYHLALASIAGPSMAALSWSYAKDALLERFQVR